MAIREFDPAGRVRELQKRISYARLDAVLLGYTKSLFYYTGTTHPSYFIVSPDDFVLLVMRGKEHVYSETWLPLEKVKVSESGFKDIERIIDSLGSSGTKLGIEMDVVPASMYLKIKDMLPDFQIEDVSRIILDHRKIKDSYELECLRHCGHIVHAGHERILSVLRDGITEIELSAEIEDAHRRAGHEGLYFHRQFDFFMGRGVLASGENLSRIAGKIQSITGMGLSPAMPLGASDRVIHRGDMVIVDIPTLYRGYHSDQSRTYVIGKTPPACRDLYEGMKDICDNTLDYIRPGVTCADIYDKALSVARESGLEPYYLRIGGEKSILPFVGHGIGLEVNEMPLLSKKNSDVIAEGTVATLEVEMWKSEREVVKLEDTFVVHADRVEILTPSPREICEI